MYVATTIRVAEGPLTVSVLGRGTASIDLDDLTDIRVSAPQDCDRLIAALAAARRMLAFDGAPHPFADGPGGYCPRCGKPERDSAHDAPPAPAPVSFVAVPQATLRGAPMVVRGGVEYAATEAGGGQA